MKDLVGKSFLLADGRYRIVDVRQLGRDAMVYAERLQGGSPAPLEPHGRRETTPRTAFHYGDIASLLECPRSA